MVYVKSLIAGTVAVAIAAVISPIVMGVYFIVVYRGRTDEVNGWDPTSFVKQPVIWAVCALIFLTAFVWEFRQEHKAEQLKKAG